MKQSKNRRRAWRTAIFCVRMASFRKGTAIPGNMSSTGDDICIKRYYLRDKCGRKRRKEAKIVLTNEKRKGYNGISYKHSEMP